MLLQTAISEIQTPLKVKVFESSVKKIVIGTSGSVFKSLLPTH